MTLFDGFSKALEKAGLAPATFIDSAEVSYWTGEVPKEEAIKQITLAGFKGVSDGMGAMNIIGQYMHNDWMLVAPKKPGDQWCLKIRRNSTDYNHLMK